ncbi:MAG: DUF192 domain-containing protein [Parvibaculaceae bacterium]|nr:DUF192 domain-containing protein [Parvibaculaceae bacterium]
MRRLFLLALLVLPLLSGCEEMEEARQARIETRAGTAHDFSVELALTPEEQQRGLMYRQELAEDAGMLFFYPACARASFWMRNTYLPLDMIFIAADGRIVRIARMTEPQTLDIHESGEKVNGVFEVNGGLTQRLGIEEGDFFRHPWFGENGRATCD